MLNVKFLVKYVAPKIWEFIPDQIRNYGLLASL